MTEAPTTDELVELYRQVAKRMYAPLDPIWLELDLSMAQLKTMLVVGQHAPVAIGRVAELLSISLPTASQLVDRLVHAGWIERFVDSEDRRRTLTRLSSRGTALVERLREGNREHVQQRLAQLSAADRAALVQGLQALQALADAADNAT